jgi:EAL domain-containing protein (putative c-di-GMP-specific phosphodiesterase class I)
VAVEVTETAVLPALASLGPGFRRLREASIGVHLDDFGTGFSSIALLRDLPVTALKLDASFVRDLATSERAHSLAAGLGGLVERLGLTGIAEGIEDAPVVPILQALGWQYGQGYLFGRPAPLPG